MKFLRSHGYLVSLIIPLLVSASCETAAEPSSHKTNTAKVLKKPNTKSWNIGFASGDCYQIPFPKPESSVDAVKLHTGFPYVGDSAPRVEEVVISEHGALQEIQNNKNMDAFKRQCVLYFTSMCGIHAAAQYGLAVLKNAKNDGLQGLINQLFDPSSIEKYIEIVTGTDVNGIERFVTTNVTDPNKGYILRKIARMQGEGFKKHTITCRSNNNEGDKGQRVDVEQFHSNYNVPIPEPLVTDHGVNAEPTKPTTVELTDRQRQIINGIYNGIRQVLKEALDKDSAIYWKLVTVLGVGFVFGALSTTATGPVGPWASLMATVAMVLLICDDADLNKRQLDTYFENFFSEVGSDPDVDALNQQAFEVFADAVVSELISEPIGKKIAIPGDANTEMHLTIGPQNDAGTEWEIWVFNGEKVVYKNTQTPFVASPGE